MLAQNFKTPAELGITDAEFDALRRTLGMFERGEVPQGLFRMNQIGAPECGTPGCIMGWALTVDHSVFRGAWGGPLRGLFIRPYELQRRNATTAEAAVALRSFLTHGDARWEEAMA